MEGMKTFREPVGGANRYASIPYRPYRVLYSMHLSAGLFL